MRYLLPALAFSLAFSASTSFAAQAPDFTGRWEISAQEFGQQALYNPINQGRLIIEFKDGEYTGAFAQLKFTGTMQPDGLHFLCSGQRGACGDLVLRISNDLLAGEGTIGGLPITITGRKALVRPAAPRRYEFEPTEFHPLYSNTTSPVLHIFAGDSVHTKTVDAGGRDERGVARSPVGNPETGPFYVEGAMPGDTLVIHFNRVLVNRDTAFQNNYIAASALTPQFLQNMGRPEYASHIWTLDRNKGVASLSQPTEKLKNFTIALVPMLGCVGVAPPFGQISGAFNLGTFGGNMDYREVREGSTLYLPVFQPGALLYLGDAHATQGDGEITGQGLETSMDVEFTVDVIENKSLGQPWIENNEYVMVMGIGGSLDDSFKLATTGMRTWLADNYQLNAAEVAAVMGNAIQYDVAEIVDPQFNVVAKIKKAVLSQIQQP